MSGVDIPVDTRRRRAAVLATNGTPTGPEEVRLPQRRAGQRI
jgi:hypothetical protein